MQFFDIPYYLFFTLSGLFMSGDTPRLPTAEVPGSDLKVVPDLQPVVVDCNCTITQNGASYPVSALLGTIPAAAFYSYGTPLISSANTGLELADALILFLYQDINTGTVSLFLIADVGNSGTGGTMEFETNCLPSTAYVSVEDDPGEFNGAPPSITGNWTWAGCCTDGGVIEDLGCGNTINLDLLVSSGLDSIVWLTGDIANPDHILLAMSGEDISINCGGGVCCPIGFDSEVTITDATCDDTPNGSIVVLPQDGVKPYTFSWSNGATTGTITGLLSGIYSVTITDAQGCTDELQLTVGVSPGDPPAQGVTLELCSDNPEAVFDLTIAEDYINLGSGFNVLWFQNQNMTGPIPNPSGYLSPTATIYAVVDNGFCLSDPVPVNLVVILQPVGIETTMNLCEEDNGTATFDLTSLDQIVSNGTGMVLWYIDAGLNIPVPNPSAFISASATIFAVVDDGICSSIPVEVELVVDPKPEGFTSGMELCGDLNDEAVFDLTLLEPTVSGGNGTVTWYLEVELFDQITSPGAFLTGTMTVYAVVFDGVCYSDAIPVDLIVNPTPVGIPVTIEQCDDGSGTAVFNLWDYASQVSGGAGGVEWYLDDQLIDLVSDPTEFITGSTVIYAIVDDGICVSAPVPVQINVLQSPVGNPSLLETCADSTGNGVFNLTSLDLEVSGGVGIVQWYQDNAGFFPITVPSAFLSSGGIVYAVITAGPCVSSFTPVNLVIINSVTANTTQYEICGNSSGVALFDLSMIENTVSGGTGQVHWFLDAGGIIPLPTPNAFSSGNVTIYANVTAGSCVSGIVAVDLLVLIPLQASDIALTFCGDTSNITTIDLTQYDTLISGNMGVVSWFADSGYTILLVDPGVFVTGDTTLYAGVSNGVCLSAPATVILTVLSPLAANPLASEYCLPAGDTLFLDLTLSDAAIGGGVTQVQWFRDSLGTIEIVSPDSFYTLAGTTVYANTTNGICTSAIVTVDLVVVVAPEATPFSIKKCGDVSGQITVDMTSVDDAVSGNTGIVTWYVDPLLINLLGNPTSLVTGDTIVYAAVTNGFCVSQGVPVSVTVVDSLTANPLIIQVCAVDMDSLTVDLTAYNNAISNGGGPVFWFADSLGIDSVFNTNVFVTTGDTLYAIVIADDCISNLATIEIEVAASYTPQPQCAFSSIDSLAISWAPVAFDYMISYSINGQPAGLPVTVAIPEFTIGGLNQGDTVTFSVTAMYNSICSIPLTGTVTCITDVCPSVVIEFLGLDQAYCRDEPFVLLDALPSGGVFVGDGVSGDTLIPALVTGQVTTLNYTWEEIVSGCIYDTTVQVGIGDPLAAPVPDCQSVSLSSILFSWPDIAAQYGYQYMINHGALTGFVLTGESSLLFDNLTEGDSVTLFLWAIGAAPCGNSDTVSVACITRQCPQVLLTITDPGDICAGDAPVQLEVLITGLPGPPVVSWSGPGIIDPAGIFDPTAASVGDNKITVTVEDDGCIYTASIVLTVLPVPVSAFEIDGIPCVDSLLHIKFTGTAGIAADFSWDLAGGQLVSGTLPFDFFISWNAAGNFSPGLVINDQGCMSGLYTLPVEIDAPLEPPLINCLEEDYYSLAVEWEPVTDASHYMVSSSQGTGTLSGLTYKITNLPDNTPVLITVTAIGTSACGPSAATIACQTLDFIPPQSFIPNIFSPNSDGINDIFLVQTNTQITRVNTFRIFDRWGNVVFERFNFPPNDQQYGWDGTFNGKLMNPAVFTWLAELQVSGGNPVLLTGEVTLIR